ncbi:DUF5777 family beta-barrel protein [Tenacibaculum agarivorans]|uniref:DUF5777 family beta-barrel protein n=1 Tax=Tenacibaculum agarivorans TaxID=1908389 RepID=UPI00094BAF0F|nr:DUF5777 family beta-barrel protein [Tenacibaculum agarivorans]
MKIINQKYIALYILFTSTICSAQNLLKELDKEYPDTPTYEIATFKTTRIGLSHSIETRKKGALEISMFNRFWNRPQGGKQGFLADEVNIRLGLDYAFTDNFTAGIGYGTYDKITDGFIKYKFVRQRKDSKKSPFSIAFYQEASFRNIYSETGMNPFYGTVTKDNSKLYGFTSQFIIARKFNTKFSAQISPTFITRNKSFAQDDIKSQFALGMGARYKVGHHVSIVSEYYANFNPVKSVTTYNPFMIGVNWELSHLLLQFQMTNARNFAKDAFIGQTTNNFNFHDGNFHFGFNATFVLHTSKNKL